MDRSRLVSEFFLREKNTPATLSPPHPTLATLTPCSFCAEHLAKVSELRKREIMLELENEKLKEQAANNTEQQFAMGDFKDILTDIVIDGQEAHNNIAGQLLKDERIFAAMQGMLAQMVLKQFQAGAKT